MALAMSDDERWIYTANRDSGSVSILDLMAASVAAEVELGERLTDIAVLDEARLLVLDNARHQLVVLTGSQRNWDVVSRLPVPKHPLQLQVDRLRGRCFIASHWSRSISCVEFADADPRTQPRLARQQTLPFEPGEILLLGQANRLVVAAAYSGSIVILDADSLDIVATHSILGHNIGGLALSHDGLSLLVTHQELNPLASSTRDDVHWGNTLTNLLTSVSVEALQAGKDKLIHGNQHFLGEPEHAASDPGKLVVGPTGVAIALGGVNELALAPEGDFDRILRVSVGQRPSNVLATEDGRWVVAEMFSDAVSIVELDAVWNAGQASYDQELETRARLTNIKLGSMREPTPAERGEELFFDGRLSHDGWMSCHSCHTQGHTSEQLNDNLSDGTLGTPKRVLSLLGVGDTRPWAWNGGMQTLDEQLASTVQNTMQGDPLSHEDLAALVAYLRTLPPPPALLEQPALPESQAVNMATGRELFYSLGCNQCHAEPYYTTTEVVDVKLADERRNRMFNPPSLRGVARRTAFFHDNRAESLTEVFSAHRHQLTRPLSSDELKALLEFLSSI